MPPIRRVWHSIVATALRVWHRIVRHSTYMVSDTIGIVCFDIAPCVGHHIARHSAVCRTPHCSTQHRVSGTPLLPQRRVSGTPLLPQRRVCGTALLNTAPTWCLTP